MYLIKNPKSVYNSSNNLDLSQQFLVECDTRSFGCDGGYSDYGLSVALQKGMPSEKTYPYKAVSHYFPYSYPKLCTSQSSYLKLPNSQNMKVILYESSTQKISDEYIINYLLKGPLVVSLAANDL